MSPAAGGAGAFSQLMQTQPALSKWLVDSVHNKRISIDQLSTSG